MPYLKKQYFRIVQQTMDKLSQRVYLPLTELKATAYITEEPLKYADRLNGRKVELHENDKWANNTFDCAWFHLEGEVPAECEGKPTVLLIDLGGEGLIVDKNGDPVQGITCVASQHDYSLGRAGKWVYPFMDEGKAGTPVDVWVDAAANDLFGILKNDGRVQTMRVGIWDKAMFELYFDMVVLVDLLKCTNERSARYNHVLFELYEACCVNDDYATLVKTAKKLLAMKGGDPSLTFTAIGHAHMDLAWLWPIRETKRKGARTFSTALSLMDRYPDYVFGASQPQYFQWMKEEYPALYARMKEKVAEGRLEPQGCAWVEADMNVSGGEALVRQFLYGKQFFMDEFGVDVKTLWLPDVFGYNAALPQLLVKSGNEVFMTQKLSWSLHNKFPHQTFRWKGIDGTEIFAHMLPEETYNSPVLPRSLRKAEENYAENGVCDEALILFGIGDGGGGPGMEHLEAAKRVKDLAGVCPAKQELAQPMLLRMKEKCWDKVPVWDGELYLERHQGTYTTAAPNKKYNRLMENTLRDLELYAVLTGDYPKAELDEIWKEVMLYQFHDILPGSSIQRVYTESQARYKILYEKTEALIAERLAKLAGEQGLTVFNSLSWGRTAIVEREDGFYRVNVPAMGYTSEQGEKVALSVQTSGNVLENRFLRAEFGADGALVSLFDKRTDTESIQSPSGKFAVWQEANADCWDIAIEYLDRKPEFFALTGQTFGMEGAEAVCRQSFTYGNSTIHTRVSLGEDDQYLTWTTDIDWQEADVMLRTAFDTSIVTDRAGFDIQYGMLHRSNNENTLWDKAQFEVCAHKWVDLSESDRGVALLNDCKYGFRVKGSVIDMDILRAQHYPSDLTDKGQHTLRYALYPHAGNEKGGQVKEAAYGFNMPLRTVKGKGEEVAACSMMAATNVIIEAVKAAEDGNGVILRAYEPYGTRCQMGIKLDGEYAITPCDLMEKTTGETFTANAIEGEVKPFEICTWRLNRK